MIEVKKRLALGGCSSLWIGVSMLPWFDRQFPLFLAPMARFTDVHFRQLCKEQGADVVITEFVQADAVVRTGAASKERLDFSGAQRPMGVQLFGSEPQVIAEAARIVEAEVAPDFIDLNFGCPAHNVTDQCAGSSLLRDLPRLGAVASAVARGVQKTPVTAKMRIGWDRQHIVCREAARVLEESGMTAIAIHGRTKEQGYRGEADWSLIGQTAAERGVPIVLNGNLREAADVRTIRESLPVAGVMIGRAAQGYPWIFREIKTYLKTGVVPEPPSPRERWATILHYAKLMVEGSHGRIQPGDIRLLRPRLQAMTKEMPGGKGLRRAFSSLQTMTELEELAAGFDASPLPVIEE